MKSIAQSGTGVLTNSSTVAERYRAPIYRYVLRLARNPSLADDLTQEVFLRVQRHLGELKDVGALEAWLYRIATNVCYDRFRQREHRRPALPLLSPDNRRDDTPADDDALRPDQLLERKEMSDCVIQFLAALPPTQRQVLLLHDLQEYTGPEIAQMLGLSLENVKIRLHRARAKLRTALADGCQFSRDDRGVFVCEPKRP